MDERRLHSDNDVPPSGDPHKRAEPYGDEATVGRVNLQEGTAIHDAPPVGEEIHMPDPTLIPIINAVGVTVALVGVTSSMTLLVVGTIIFLVTTVLWVRDTRREIASLPAGHDHH